MPELSELWMVGMLLAAFAGGAFGSAIGALPAFVFTGFMVMLGETAGIVGSDLLELMSGEAALVHANSITASLGFGPLFGPHISFAAGAAASAYASKKGYMETGFAYHEAKNIAYALGPKPDVLIVGGLFGIAGYWITTLSAAFSLPWDPIAVGVVLSAVLHRVILRYPMIGEAKSGLFNMEPFAEGTTRNGGGNRLLVEPWLGHQYKWTHVGLLGVVTGILAAFITFETGSIFLPFGISAASLLFLNLGVEKFPVTHHMTLIGSTSVVAYTGGAVNSIPLYSALLLGALFGLTAALAGEVIQRIFYAHSDTHFDPPAAAIVACTFLIVLLAASGLFADSAWIPMPF